MTGRAAALAAGHGFMTGWAIAIAGDMLYYGVIAFTTLRLNAYFRDPNTTMAIVLGAMIIAPLLVRRLKSELPPSWDGKPRFPKRHLEAIEVDYSDEEREVHAWLQEYSKLRQQNVSDSLERYAGEFVLKLLK